MTYTAFNPALPDGAGNGTVTLGDIRKNLQALRDMVVAGTLTGFDAVVSGGTAEQPTQVLHNRGTSEYIKEVIVWGTTGGATGNPETIAYSYSAVSGGAGAYDTIGTLTYTFDTNGNVLSWAWS